MNPEALNIFLDKCRDAMADLEQSMEVSEEALNWWNTSLLLIKVEVIRSLDPMPEGGRVQ